LLFTREREAVFIREAVQNCGSAGSVVRTLVFVWRTFLDLCL